MNVFEGARRIAVVCAAAAVTIPFPAFARTEIELWRDGYRPVWESSYEDVEECEPDKPVKLSGGFYFECAGYHYVYHYGAVKLMSKVVDYQGRRIELTYLCMDEDEDCLEGSLLRLR